ALTLGIPLGGFLAQVTRDEFDVALRQPFVLSALSRGARSGDVRWRQVLRHAALPGIALSGWGLGSLISGAVVVEVIFSRQGIGQVLVAAVTAQDLPLVIGVTFVVAAVYVVANILSALASVLVDPRLRHAIGRASWPPSPLPPPPPSRSSPRPRAPHGAGPPRPAAPASWRPAPWSVPCCSQRWCRACWPRRTRSQSASRRASPRPAPNPSSAPTSPVATCSAVSSTVPASPS